MSDLFKKITYKELADLFWEAERFIYLAAPGLFEDWAEWLIEIKQQTPNINIQVIIDPTEDGFRKNYGEVDAVSMLADNDITVKQYKHHRLGFIATDKTGYFLFNQSRAIEKEVRGYNAIQMATTTKGAIGIHCFGIECATHEISGFQKALDKEVEELETMNDKFVSEGRTSITPELLDTEALSEVKQSVEQYPPVSPDLQRLLNVYFTKIKFVEFSTKGIKISNRTVKIPNDILKLADYSLRDQITTRLDIFNDELKTQIEQLTNPIKDKADKLREQYFYPVASRHKNVMKANEQKRFQKEILKLKEDYKKAENKIYRLLNDALQDVKERLSKEITTIYMENPPTAIERYEESDQLRMFAKSEAEGAVNGISIPSLQELASSFKIEYNFFDPTYEDLKDEDFIGELFEGDFIDEAERDQIVREIQAVGVQPEE